MTRRLDFILRENADYIDAQFVRWQSDPSSVAEDWACSSRAWSWALAGKCHPATHRAGPYAGVRSLVHAFREFGHLAARLDPAGTCQRGPAPVSRADRVRAQGGRSRPRGGRLGVSAARSPARCAHLIEALRETYCGTLAVEYMDISDPEVRDWLAERIEVVEQPPAVLGGRARRDPARAARRGRFRAVPARALHGPEALLARRWREPRADARDAGARGRRRWASRCCRSACRTAAGSTCSRTSCTSRSSRCSASSSRASRRGRPRGRAT